MYLYFGIVKVYLSEKGFGFLSHPISLGPYYGVFFHINTVKEYDENLAERLSKSEIADDMCFWYICETTYKGEQVKKILTPEDVFSLEHEEQSQFLNEIKAIYNDIEKPLPLWLNDVTIGLLGSIRKDELKLERNRLIQKRNEELEELRKEQERLRKIEEEKARIKEEKERRIYEEQREKERKQLEREREKAEEERRLQREKEERQQKIEEEEFELLVAEMESKGFTQTGEVSNYIIRHKLGNKYQNISGVVQMQNSSSSWNFNGGFPPKIYARLCSRLNLGNKGTNAQAVGFTSFKDLKNRK